MSFICRNAYLLKCYFTRPNPKNKYAICVCEQKPLFFFISTNPRTRFNPDSQLHVSTSDLSFLNHDSYINTAEVVTCTLHHTCDILKDYGSIPNHIKEQIIKKVHDSNTLPQRFVDLIINKISNKITSQQRDEDLLDIH